MQTTSSRLRPDAGPLRYRPALVVLHWLLTILVLGLLALGFLVLAPMADADPVKVSILRGHMIGGIVTLGAVVLFAILRWRLGAPARLTAGRVGFDRLSIVVHRGFYLVVTLMAVSGIATSAIAGLPPIIFGGSGEPLPAFLHALPSLRAHALLAILLIAMIGLHIAGALYHQFALRDRLLSRMGLGASSESTL